MDVQRSQSCGNAIENPHMTAPEKPNLQAHCSWPCSLQTTLFLTQLSVAFCGGSRALMCAVGFVSQSLEENYNIHNIQVCIYSSQCH